MQAPVKVPHHQLDFFVGWERLFLYTRQEWTNDPSSPTTVLLDELTELLEELPRGPVDGVPFGVRSQAADKSHFTCEDDLSLSIS
jgi:hypothetical protein